MEKILIVEFVKGKRRGVYDAIINEYSSIIIDWRVSLLKSVIESDLEKLTGEKVKLNYFSLAKSVRKFKNKKPIISREKKPSTPHASHRYDFKDAHELDENESIKPGSFKL